MTDRNELESLGRDALIARAESAGVKRARILTRAELVDEILLSTSPRTSRSRGFFGRARDLLARVVERGLHLPDAADRLRNVAPPAPPLRPSHAMPTVTLAEIYAAQGHVDRAVDTLKRVLVREPEHAAARALLAKYMDSEFVPAEPPLPPEDDTTDDVFGLATPDSEPPVITQRKPRAEVPIDHEACVALSAGNGTLFVYWEIREPELSRARDAAQAGALVVRVVAVTPTWDGPRSEACDFLVNGARGDFIARDLPGGAVLRAAVGWRDGSAFSSFAHAAPVEAAEATDSAIFTPSLVRWTPRGAQPIALDAAENKALARALGVARTRFSAPDVAV